MDHAVNRHRNGDPDAPSSNIARCCKNRTDQEGKAMNGEHPVWRLTANVPLELILSTNFITEYKTLRSAEVGMLDFRIINGWNYRR